MCVVAYMGNRFRVVLTILDQRFQIRILRAIIEGLDSLLNSNIINTSTLNFYFIIIFFSYSVFRVLNLNLSLRRTSDWVVITNTNSIEVTGRVHYGSKLGFPIFNLSLLLCVYIYMCVCMYVYVCVYVYICMCIYIHVFLHINYTFTLSHMCTFVLSDFKGN